MCLAKWPGIWVFELKFDAMCIFLALGACLLGVCATGTSPSGAKNFLFHMDQVGGYVYLSLARDFNVYVLS